MKEWKKFRNFTGMVIFNFFSLKKWIFIITITYYNNNYVTTYMVSLSDDNSCILKELV